MIQGITFDPPPALFLSIAVMIGIVIGWVIGFLDSNLRTSKKIEAAEARADNAVSEAEQKIAAAQVRPETAAMADEPGLLRLKNVDGVPALEIDGTPVNVRSVSSDQKKRLIELLTFMRPWVEGGSAPQAPARPAAPVNAPAAPAPPQPAETSVKATFTQPIPPIKPAEEKNIRSLSIVAQIDTVLQARLATSHLASRGIRLTESSMGGVEVYVGLDKYATVDEVPDAEIKQVIRTAIAEWEDKYTPGMTR